MILLPEHPLRAHQDENQGKLYAYNGQVDLTLYNSQSIGLLTLYEEEWLYVCWNDAFAEARTALGNSVCRQYGYTRAANVKQYTHL